jgi:hypothetical protein
MLHVLGVSSLNFGLETPYHDFMIFLSFLANAGIVYALDS